MSDAEIRRRKKLQGHISQTTGALGLTALGGTLLATKTGSNATKQAFKAVNMTRPSFLKPKKLKKATAPLLATSAGIGGAGSFNFASYTAAEGRKRKMQQPVKKAWEPQARNYSPESKRMRRAQNYERAGYAGAAAASAGAIAAGSKAVSQRRSVSTPGYKRAAGLPSVANKIKNVKTASNKNAAIAGASAITGLASFAAAQRAKKERTQGSWQPYSKSAFGVVSKVGDWKTIDQREHTQRRARKVMRAAGAGVGLGVGALTFGHSRGGTAAATQVFRTAKNPMFGTKKDAFRTAAHVAEHHVKTNPGGAGATLGGAALLAGSAAAGGAAKTGHTYNQHKINQRRRNRYSKKTVKKDARSAFGVLHD